MTDSMQQMALDTLGAYFGYTSFRPGQDRMVDAILAGRDALGVMPTGAGKSICYQVPALMLPGITFVVSPLLSLMEDQTRALLAAGARPSYLNSSLTPAQQNTVLKRAREGRYQLMYVAPERLLEPRFLAFAQEAASEGGIGVPLVAIDEAHCVSQWGQDFRPAYLQIREFIDSLPQRPIVAAFTATATERVRADIQQMLGLQNPATVVTGFDRKNLYFGCEEMGDKAKTAWVRDYVIAHSSESGIVYCSTRKTVDALAGELAEALGPSGIRVGRYHAGMGNDARRQSQRAFIDDDIQVMVATNAFGMGIDKPNVRYVIHNNVPESIEAYYQEAGRAGRDGDPASCHLLWNGNDFRMRRFLIDRGDAADEALDAVAGLTADNTVTEPVVEAQPEPVVAAEPVAETQPAATTQHTTTTETTVNPDDVSDEILAADIIDPTDAQASDFPFEVGEIAQVYNVNGELETTTTITAEDGTEMVLVDVNGDQMFDVARDAYGNEVELGVVSTVSDMEMLHAQQQGDTTGYLAASDTDPMPDDNSFEADIIDPTTLG